MQADPSESFSYGGGCGTTSISELLTVLASLLRYSSSDCERISSDLKTQSSVQRKPLCNISLRDTPKRFLEIIILIVREIRNSCLFYFLFTLSWITVHVQKGPPPQKRGTLKSPGNFLMKQNKPPDQHPVLLKHSWKTPHLFGLVSQVVQIPQSSWKPQIKLPVYSGFFLLNQKVVCNGGDQSQWKVGKF